MSNWSKVPIRLLTSCVHSSVQLNFVSFAIIPFALFCSIGFLLHRLWLTKRKFNNIFSPIMATVTPLFEWTTDLTGMPFLDRSNFLRMCMLKPASWIKTQFWLQSMLLSFCYSSTLSLRNCWVLWAVLAVITDSNFLKANETWRIRCLWRLDKLTEPIWGNISSNASLACQSTTSGLWAKKVHKNSVWHVSSFPTLWVCFFWPERRFSTSSLYCLIVLSSSFNYTYNEICFCCWKAVINHKV